MKITLKLLLGATLVAGLSISAFAACATDVDFGSTDGTNGKSITGLKNPANPQDAATKAYVDSLGIHYKEVDRFTCNGTDQNISLDAYGSGFFKMKSGLVQVDFFHYRNNDHNFNVIGSSGYQYPDFSTAFNTPLTSGYNINAMFRTDGSVLSCTHATVGLYKLQ